VPDTSLPFTTRLWFAWVCFFRVLFDGNFAIRAFRAHRAEAGFSLAPPGLPKIDSLPPTKPSAKLPVPTESSMTPALQLLSLLQREGRLVDFVEQDITGFDDADIGAAARVVHEGCRKALREHLKVAPVRTEEEGAKVTLVTGFSPAEVKLSGDVRGTAPYSGVLRHKGWRVTELKLPVSVEGHDAKVIAPAEVEL
jgi:hypothetical protein